MKNSSNTIFGIMFLLAGLGIIIAIYFLFLRECQEKNLFILNITATCVVFAVVYLRSFDIFGTVGKVAHSGAGYGLKWHGVSIYAPLALILIILSIIFGWGFSFCLIGHLIFLFILLMFFFLGSVAKDNVNNVTDKIEARKSGLKEIAIQLDMLEMQCRLGAGGDYLDLVNALRENVRYITASDKRAAIDLENKLIAKIRLITGQIEHTSQSGEVVKGELEECLAIMELRKKQY